MHPRSPTPVGTSDQSQSPILASARLTLYGLRIEYRVSYLGRQQAKHVAVKPDGYEA